MTDLDASAPSSQSEGAPASQVLHEEFTARLEEIYGHSDAVDILNTMAAPKRFAFWVNTLRDVEIPEAAHPVAGLDDCFELPAGQRDAFMRLEATIDGDFYPMNPASIAAARCLDVAPGQEVLDLAAAPGGKTLQLASMMANTGRIAAVEPVKGRFHRLRANLQRCGVTNTSFYLADGRSIGRKVPGRFDRVLLDAPCSSESRIRLDQPDSFQHWKPRKIKECARKQRALLQSALAATRPGGLLLYCTCAFAPEENELVVDSLLGRGGVTLLPVTLAGEPRTLPGLTEWRGRALDNTLARTVRVLPDQLWDGFYLALMQKDAADQPEAQS